MGSQLRTMRGQLATMVEQTKHLEASVGAAQSNATAAKEGAEATKRSIEMQISKERARITVSKPDRLDLAKYKSYTQVSYTVEVWAPTLAIIVETKVWAYISPSRDTDRWFSASMEIESKDTRSTTTIQRHRILLDSVNEELIAAINTREKFAHFYGTISYRDAFQSENDVPHETTFSYIWEVGTDVTNVAGRIPAPPKIGERYVSEWVEHPTGSNKET